MTTPPPGYEQQGQYPEGSQATTVLVLGILGLVTCPILGPIAWQMGQKELEAIDSGRRPPQNRNNANVGRILGIIGTVILALAVLIVIVSVLFLVVAGVTTSR